MENLIQAKLRIITQEQPLRKLRGLFCPLRSKHSYVGFEKEGCTTNDVDSLRNPDLQVQSGGSL